MVYIIQYEMLSMWVEPYNKRFISREIRGTRASVRSSRKNAAYNLPFWSAHQRPECSPAWYLDVPGLCCEWTPPLMPPVEWRTWPVAREVPLGEWFVRKDLRAVRTLAQIRRQSTFQTQHHTYLPQLDGATGSS